MSESDFSFLNYLKMTHSSLVSRALQKYIDENKHRPIFFTCKVQRPSYAALSKMEFCAVKCSGEEDYVLKFWLKVAAAVEIQDDAQRHDCIKRKLLVFGQGILNGGLSSVEIIGIEPFQEERFNINKYLTKTLLPYIGVKELDKYAESFLKKYYPAALEKPMPIPVHSVLEAMQITAYPASLPEGTAGRIYFDKATVEIIKDGKNVPMEIGKGTILYAQNEMNDQKIGSINNTIIHECVHWHLHYRYFELRKLLDPQFSLLSCAEMEQYKRQNDEEIKDIDWMEWHASAIAPRILIPERAGRLKLQEILDDLSIKMPQARKAEIMERVIAEFASFFQVSIQAAKIRALDLGYEQAKGVFNYIDGHYCPPFSFAPESIKRNQTFSVSLFDLVRMLSLCKEECVPKGFAYVDGMYVLNDPKYTYVQNGEVKMTIYALDHADECCLIFDYETVVDRLYDDFYYSTSFLCRKPTSASAGKATLKKIDIKNEQLRKIEEALGEEGTKLLKARKELEEYSKLGGTFQDALNWFVKKKGFSNEKLAEETGISERSITTFRGEGTISLNNAIVLVCVLSIPTGVVEDFLRRAGYSLRFGNDRDRYLRHMLIDCSIRSVPTINKILESARLPKISDKFSEQVAC